MKQFLFIISLLITFSLSSQTIERTVIGSSGTTLSTANASLDFTIGDLVVTTSSNGSNTLTQGFQQETIVLKIKLAPIAFLQGPLTTSGTTTMDDSLRSNSLLPTTSPYADALTCESTVFDTTGNDAIVDWILVEFRDATDPTMVMYSQSALLQRDGDVVDVDGISDIALELADHHVVVPMFGMVESLNVSVAGALIMYGAQRQRIEAGMYQEPKLDEKIRHQMLNTQNIYHMSPNQHDSYGKHIEMKLASKEASGTCFH